MCFSEEPCAYNSSDIALEVALVSSIFQAPSNTPGLFEQIYSWAHLAIADEIKNTYYALVIMRKVFISS